VCLCMWRGVFGCVKKNIYIKRVKELGNLHGIDAQHSAAPAGALQYACYSHVSALCTCCTMAGCCFDASKDVQRITRIHRLVVEYRNHGRSCTLCKTNARNAGYIYSTDRNTPSICPRRIPLLVSGRRASCPLYSLCFLDFGRPRSLPAAQEAEGWGCGGGAGPCKSD